MKLGKAKGKTLGGAPRSGKWTRDTPERTRLGGEHRGSLILLLLLGALIVVAMVAFGFVAQRRLSDGLVGQFGQQRRRPDWVRLEQLPPHVAHAFLAVVDTASFQRVSPYGATYRPEITTELVGQVHRLEGGVADQAWRAAMVPLAEAQLSRRDRLEFYLNRISLGKTGDWSVYGVKHAAEEYFGKDVRRLTVGEAATLAGILLPPRLDNPEAAPGAVGARRNEVLRRMVDAGDIDPAQYRQALAEPLAFQPGIDYAPMTRPAGWEKEPEPIRLPPELRPVPRDSAAAAATTSPAP